MKTLLLAAPLLALAACSGSSNCDSGDTACGVSGDDILIQTMDGECSGGSCTWYVEYTGEGGQVDLDLAETGDPTATCGPSSTKGLSECGFWTEYHNAFSLADFNDAGETKELTLELVGSFEDQVQNSSTIFDVSDGTISNQLTVMFTVYDSAGAYADCAVYGDDVGWFSDYCTNNADLW